MLFLSVYPNLRLIERQQNERTFSELILDYFFTYGKAHGTWPKKWPSVDEIIKADSNTDNSKFQERVVAVRRKSFKGFKIIKVDNDTLKYTIQFSDRLEECTIYSDGHIDRRFNYDR